jgi:hypothetical protein
MADNGKNGAGNQGRGFAGSGCSGAGKVRIAPLALAAVLASVAASAADLPDPKLTPGVARTGVTAFDLCPVAHTPALRNVPESEKMAVYKSYGILPHQGYCVGKEGCEVDHLISLELGGANDQRNLWPQSYDAVPWNAHVKDKLENKLHALVCANTITLEDAQNAIRLDWIAAYKKYIGTSP